MEKSKIKICSVFQTKEQEELFAKCVRETMFRYMSSNIPHSSIDESMNNGNVTLSPVFQTKEQEELFAKRAQEVMFIYMNEENTKYKTLIK